MQVLDAETLLAGIRCSIISCIQSVFSPTICNSPEGYAVKLNANILLDEDKLQVMDAISRLASKGFSLPARKYGKGDKILKHCHMRSCIQSCWWFLGLHPKNLICYPGNEYNQSWNSPEASGSQSGSRPTFNTISRRLFVKAKPGMDLNLPPICWRSWKRGQCF